jgi:hypothetical protein
MNRLALLAILALAAACDEGILQPEAAAPPEVAAAAVPVTPANGGWEFTTVATFAGAIDPGTTRITRGNIMHWDGILYAYVLTGDLEGMWYWSGKANVDLDRGTGVLQGELVIFDLTSPGAGTFECRTLGHSEDTFGPQWSLGGPMMACHGSGDFEGMHMKGYGANRPGEYVFDIRGVIW